VCPIIIIIIMASPASKAGGSAFGRDVELGGGGEQFVTAHIVHHRDGSQTVHKQIITPFAGSGDDDIVVIHETERHPPPPSYYVNDPHTRVIPGAATSTEPSVSSLAVASLVLGCIAVGFLLIGWLVWPVIFLINLGVIPVLAITFGSVAFYQINQSRRRQQAGEVVRQWRGQWQAITGMTLGSVVGAFQIFVLVVVVLGWE
jgi:hypothetical protein